VAFPVGVQLVQAFFTPLQEVRAKSTPERSSSVKALDFIQLPQDKIEHPFVSTEWREVPRNTVALLRFEIWRNWTRCPTVNGPLLDGRFVASVLSLGIQAA
jgi:hypothetical protein